MFSPNGLYLPDKQPWVGENIWHHPFIGIPYYWHLSCDGGVACGVGGGGSSGARCGGGGGNCRSGGGNCRSGSGGSGAGGGGVGGGVVISKNIIKQKNLKI